MPHYESSGDFVVQDNNVVIKPITMDNNTYINNSKFMEFIDELATQFTETEFKENTFEESKKIYDGNDTYFTKDAQNYYNQKYDEIETMANKIMGLYTDNDKPRKAILEQQELNRKIAEKEDAELLQKEVLDRANKFRIPNNLPTPSYETEVSRLKKKWKDKKSEYYRICSKCNGENTHNIDDFGFCKHCLAHL